MIYNWYPQAEVMVWVKCRFPVKYCVQYYISSTPL